MLLKLIRPFMENGWSRAKLVSIQNLSTSTVRFQQSFSGTNSGAASKPTEKSPSGKNQQEKIGNKKQNRAESDVEQEQTQQEGPADKAAEQKSSKSDEKMKKMK